MIRPARMREPGVMMAYIRKMGRTNNTISSFSVYPVCSAACHLAF